MPVLRFHILRLLVSLFLFSFHRGKEEFSLKLKSLFPSGLKFTLVILFVFPMRVCNSLPVFASQILILLLLFMPIERPRFPPNRCVGESPLPLAIFFPSGLKLTLVTALVSPSRVCNFLPVSTSQILMLPSSLPLAIFLPSGL